MSVFQIMYFIIIISSVFLCAHSGDVTFSAVIPQTITALTDTCVQIPCTFKIPNFEENLNKSISIYGIWLKKKHEFGDSDSFIAFNSSKNIIRGFTDIQMTGNLSERNCTTVFYNIMKNHSDVYYFRLEMEPNVFRATFNTPDHSEKTVKITVIDSPQPPKLSTSNLRNVIEGSVVDLICSAEAPCPKRPPTISWSNIPESANITTQLHEKPNKTQSVFSHMSFTASYRDHRKNISCTATYPRNTSKDSTVKATVMLRVLFPPKETHIIIRPSASVSVGTIVTLTCKSKASPSNGTNYSWFKREQKMSVDYGKKITFNVTHDSTGWYSCTAQNKYGNQSSEEMQLTVEGQDGRSIIKIAGCVGGIVAFLTLSALGFCTRKKSHRRSNVEEKDSLNKDEPMDRNSTCADVLTAVTNQDKKISEDQSVCDDKTNIITGKDSRDENSDEKGSDVVYAQVQILQKKSIPKTENTSVQHEDIYSQVKK